MKKTVLIGLFVFSLALNLAVAATLGWHVWRESRLQAAQIPSEPSLSNDDLLQIRKAWKSNRTGAMRETRRKIVDKQLELLDEIAKNPGRPEAAEKQLNELVALKGEIERQAVARISHTLAELPQDKRQAFLIFLKTRSCIAPGKGMGGRGGMGWCPAREPVGQ